MNICILTSSFPAHSGDIPQAPFLIDFISQLKKRGHSTFVFTPDRRGVKENVTEAVKVEWFRWLTSKKPLVQLNPFHPSDSFRIWNLIYNGRKAILPFVKKNKIDACLALWVLPSGYFAKYVHQKIGTPYSLWALGSDIYRYGGNPVLYPLLKRIVHGAREVFADGFDLAKRVEGRFGRRCHFLATTRKIPLRLPSPEGENSRSRDETYRFLFVGRIEEVKGIDLLLRAMAMLANERLDVHLTIVGRGSLEEWAREFIRRKGLGKWVTWKGQVDDAGLASLYVTSDCVVIPSRSESIPLVFSEALDFNKDLIVTDVGDMGSLGRQYGVAWVVPPEDTWALSEMMKKRAVSRYEGIGTDPKKREGLKRLFDIERSVERFLEDYR